NLEDHSKDGRGPVSQAGRLPRAGITIAHPNTGNDTTGSGVLNEPALTYWCTRLEPVHGPRAPTRRNKAYTMHANLPDTLRRSSRVPITVPMLVTSLEPGPHFSEICET